MGFVSSTLRTMFLVAPAPPKLYFGGHAQVISTGETKVTMSEFLEAYVPSLYKDYTPAWWLPTCVPEAGCSPITFLIRGIGVISKLRIVSLETSQNMTWLSTNGALAIALTEFGLIGLREGRCYD